ncbi:hypothetical protein KEM55_006246 [Ascosphaera atra]|nr:hypothetical protein KEM55_006246 [Ascosphaera atra]
MSESQYDPYVPRSNTNTPAAREAGGNNRTAALQATIDDTVGVMKDNINAATRRGEGLENLEDKSDALVGSAGQFKRNAGQARKRMWWKNKKMGCCLCIGILILIIVIVVPVAVEVSRHKNSNKDSSNGN